MIVNPHMLPKVRSDELMRAMNGMPCSLRIASLVPGRRCDGPDTTVGCHLPVIGKGTSTKVSDLFVAGGCHVCHDIVDGRDQEALRYIQQHAAVPYMERLLNALCETQSRLVGDGIIIVKGGEIV